MGNEHGLWDNAENRLTVHVGFVAILLVALFESALTSHRDLISDYLVILSVVFCHDYGAF